MVQQAIQNALESWVENGRQRESIRDGRSFVLRYGRRFKLQHVVTLVIFASFCGLAAALLQQGDRTRTTIACFGFFGLLALFSTVYVAYVFTTRVIIDDARVTVRCFGLTLSQCTAETFATAYKSPVHDSVVLRSLDGRKTRISIHLDGLRSLVAWLWLRPPNTLTDSIILWMKLEAPDMDQPGDGHLSLDSEFAHR